MGEAVYFVGRRQGELAAGDVLEPVDIAAAATAISDALTGMRPIVVVAKPKSAKAVFERIGREPPPGTRVGAIDDKEWFAFPLAPSVKPATSPARR